MFFRIIFTIVCVVGLLYQTSILYKQYSLGKTVVNMRVTQPNNDQLPGITICFHNLLSFERMAHLAPNITINITWNNRSKKRTIKQI